MEGVQVCSSSPGPQEQKFPIKSEPDFRSSPGLPSSSGSLNETIVSVPHVQQVHHHHRQQQQQSVEQSQQSDLPLLVGKLLGGCNNSTSNQSPVLISRHHLAKHSHTRSQVSIAILKCTIIQ